MYSHGPSCMKGPLSRVRPWWILSSAVAAEASDGLPPSSPAVLPRTGSIRRHLVDRIRAEIAAGAYDTPEKWEAALDWLLRQLEADEQA